VTIGGGDFPAARGGLAIFDDSTERPTQVPGQVGFFDTVQWAADASTLLAATNSTTVTLQSFNLTTLALVDSTTIGNVNSSIGRLVRRGQNALHSTLQEARSSWWLERLYTDVNNRRGLRALGKAICFITSARKGRLDFTMEP
jgi:hypothetical protein